MAPSLRRALLGASRERRRWHRDAAAVALVFLATLAAYAVGVFRIQGGVVWLAGDAALLGVLAAVALAYRGRGLLVAWAAVYAALLGYGADHYLLGIAHRPVTERLAALLALDGLAFLAAEAVALGTLAWACGALLGRAVRAVRGRAVDAG